MAEPTLRHFPMPGGGRMDPVPNPIGRPGLPADKFFTQGVEGNQPGTRFFCQFPDRDGQFVAAETAVVELIARTRPVLSLLIPGKGVGAARATRHQKSP